jgi:protein SCO1
MSGIRLGVALGGLALAASLALLARWIRPRAALPVYGHVPDFHLVDERSVPFSAESMLGHVSVVDFVFTRCTSSCPRLTARMGDLQARLQRSKSDARLVSVSVDPENDTPPVLAEYAARAHADAARWSFLTGPAEDVTRAVVSGFKVSAVKVAKGANDYDVTHGDWFVLVDARGDLRGYYAVDQGEDLQGLVEDVLRLERGRR